VSAFPRIGLCVESGTFDGETAIHLAAVCKTVYTIELSPSLGVAAQRRFDWAWEQYKRNITLLVGNSGELLWDRRIQVERSIWFFEKSSNV
jgi:predicted O-methyltransferase YrrM